MFSINKILWWENPKLFLAFMSKIETNYKIFGRIQKLKNINRKLSHIQEF